MQSFCSWDTDRLTNLYKFIIGIRTLLIGQGHRPQPQDLGFKLEGLSHEPQGHTREFRIFTMFLKVTDTTLKIMDMRL